MSGNYKDTLNLPQTAFPMKASLTQREPEMLEVWNRTKLYERIQLERAAAPAFVLHDGPPYANGDVHIGTALNKILKDIVVKSKTMEGFRSPYVPGWDCHGLPIELKVLKDVEKEKTRLTQAQVRARCREYAEKYIDIQRKQFMRLGVLGDWFQPYLTMLPEYEAEIVAAFYEMAKKGFVYRAHKPVYWCISCRTALAAATAEAEYADHKSPSVYVKFKTKQDDNTFVLIWTTTPWTLPANLAIAVHPNFDYVFAKVGNETWIVAEALLSTVASKAGVTPEVLKKVKGKELEGLVTRHPFVERGSPVVLADYVTLETGTGCVHTAPGHGLEDYVTGQRYKLEPNAYSPLDDAGRFLADGKVPEWLVGKKVFEANPLIVEHLKNISALVASEEVSHSYPHCWRCKKPVIFRATEQWFIRVDHNGLRQKALDVIPTVKWVPSWGENRITGMVKERPDWVVSRQRIWGVPIPVISCSVCKHTFHEQSDRIIQMIREHGVDVWFEKTANEMLAGVTCPQCAKPTEFKKEEDILDVWFESGVSHRAVLKARKQLQFPAGVYLEGSDQHRGWFQSSLWTALATDGAAPFKTVVTHGFIVDEDRQKISKSKQGAGGYEKPQTSEAYVGRFGADILRLWIASQDFHNDIVVSEERLNKVAETYMKVRNTFRFMLSNLFDFDPAKHAVPHAQLQEIDRWALSRLQQLVEDCVKGYDAYEFHKVYHAVNQFSTVDLSSFYFDILKDSLYTLGKDSKERRSSQTSLFEILTAMTRLVAPILSFTAEEIWRCAPDCAEKQKHDSVHLTLWPKPDARVRDKELEMRWEALRAVRSEVLLELEKSRQEAQIGKSLQAAVTLEIKDAALYDVLNLYLGQLPALFIVSQVRLSKSEAGVNRLSVRIEKATGNKCERCWRWSDTVGRMKDHPDLCDRCDGVIKQISVTH
ncbi:MAG: isoleucine--tRNA ligase [Verrucomicrobiae bacterium]|nr:isoleucine--tRNA ligase [Verrucomicrobiae bacterium]